MVFAEEQARRSVEQNRKLGRRLAQIGLKIFENSAKEIQWRKSFLTDNAGAIGCPKAKTNKHTQKNDPSFILYIKNKSEWMRDLHVRLQKFTRKT